MSPSKQYVVVLLALAALSMAAAQVPPPPPPPATGTCEPLELRVCSSLLSRLLDGLLPGSRPADEQCCELLGGLAGIDAAVCLCTALRDDNNVLGIANLNVPIAVRLLLGRCGTTGVPAGFTCA